MLQIVDRRWNKTLKSGMVAGGLSGFLGLLCLAMNILETLAGPSQSLVGSLEIFVLGVGHLLCSGWIISVSREKNRKIAEDAVIAFSPLDNLALTWTFWVSAEVLSVISLFVGAGKHENGMILTVCAVLLLSSSAILFSAYRNRAIVLEGDRLECTNAFGGRKTFGIEDVRSVKWNLNTGSCKIMNSRGKKLFHFYLNSPGSREMIQALPGVAEALAQARKAEEKPNPEPDNPPELVHRVRVLARVLFAVDLLLMITLILLYRNTGWPKIRWYYLLMELIPLDFLVLSWLFPSVISETDKKVPEKWWKEQHISVLCYEMVLILINLIVNSGNLDILVHCVEGGDRVFLIGVLLYAVLFLISMIRFGVRRSRRAQLLDTGLVLLACCCLGLTQTIFMISGADTSVYTKARIAGLGKSSGKNAEYYATVILENGDEERLKVWPTIYNCIQNGEGVVLCTWTGMLDTKFVTLYLP